MAKGSFACCRVYGGANPELFTTTKAQRGTVIERVGTIFEPAPLERCDQANGEQHTPDPANRGWRLQSSAYSRIKKGFVGVLVPWCFMHNPGTAVPAAVILSLYDAIFSRKGRVAHRCSLAMWQTPTVDSCGHLRTPFRFFVCAEGFG